MSDDLEKNHADLMRYLDRLEEEDDLAARRRFRELTKPTFTTWENVGATLFFIGFVALIGTMIWMKETKSPYFEWFPLILLGIYLVCTIIQALFVIVKSIRGVD